MIFKGIDIYNCRELKKNPATGGYAISRLPYYIGDSISGDQFTDCGVELRFVPIDDEIKITIRKVKPGVSRVAVYYGSVQSGWQNLLKNIYDTPTEIVIPKSKNLEALKTITEINDLPYSHEVVRVVLQNVNYEIFDVQGKCVPPEPHQLPKRKYLAYGSSITHGSLAVMYANTYVSRIGEYFNADPINMGFAGNARLEHEMADYLADEIDFDFATLEMGINLLNKIDDDEFRKRVKYFILAVANAHHDKKIFCIDIFFQNTDICNRDDPNAKANRFRKIVRDVIAEIDLPNVIYIPGLEMLTSSKGLSEDLVHPNARGVEEMSANLCRFMEKYI